jgi:hypothetical protein
MKKHLFALISTKPDAKMINSQNKEFAFAHIVSCTSSIFKFKLGLRVRFRTYNPFKLPSGNITIDCSKSAPLSVPSHFTRVCLVHCYMF